MTTPVDLDALEAKHAAATPGPYTADLRERTVRSPDDTLIVDYSMGEVASQDLVCIAALHNALPALIAELRTLREVAEAAREFVPMCQETRFDEASEQSHACGRSATHMDRMNGHDTNLLCAEHAETALYSATKAASKGHTRALELDAPRPLESNPRVDALRTALAKVPR